MVNLELEFEEFILNQNIVWQSLSDNEIIQVRQQYIQSLYAVNDIHDDITNDDNDIKNQLKFKIKDNMNMNKLCEELQIQLEEVMLQHSGKIDQTVQIERHYDQQIQQL